MARKRGRNKGSGGEGGGSRPGKGGPGENWGKEEMRQAASPLIASHPSGALVAVAFGATVRVYHLALDRLVALASDLDADAAIASDQPPGADASAPAPAADPAADPPAWHSDVIRAIRFDPTGRFMLTAGDDKLARVWRVHLDHPAAPAVRCVRRALLPKKLCAACFSDDGEHALFANKFGDVHALATTTPPPAHAPAPGSNPTANDDDAAPEDAAAGGATFLLGHCCSIITDACVLPGTNLVCTSDRDHKVRVSVLPTTAPLAEGSHEIQSFCHGHTAFVACVASTLGSKDAPGRAGKIVTGGGDGTVRLWNAEDGVMLDAVTLAEPHADEEQQGGGGDVGGEGEGGGATEADADVAGAGGESDAAVTRGEAPREATRAPAVFAVAVNASGVVVAAVEGRDEFAALVISQDGTKLRLEGWRALPESLAGAAPKHFAAAAAAEGSDGFWGVAEAGAEEGAEACVFVVDATGAAATEAAAAAAAALRARGPGGGRGVGDAMRKKVYDEDEREGRKKGRRDKTTFSAAAAAYQKEKETETRQP
jgi:hypothetical protein